MKRNLILMGLVLFGTGFIFNACDPNNKKEKDPAIWWNQNALTMLQLRGKVKQITSNETGTIVFNENGTIASQDNSNYIYNQNGLLTRINYCDTINDEIYNSSTILEYGSHGKYTPNFTFHINEAGLTKNLSKITEIYGNEKKVTEYTFKGDSLFIYGTYTYTGDGQTLRDFDTVVFLYSGDFPTSYRRDNDGHGEFFEASYQSNGMFKEYSEGFFSTDSIYGHIDKRTTTYRTNCNYMLPLSHKEVTTYADNTSDNWQETYTYNDEDDPLTTNTSYYDSEGNSGSSTTISFSDYVYDAEGNWISRNAHQPNGSTQTQTRFITYF